MATALAQKANNNPLLPHELEGQSRVWEKAYVITTNCSIDTRLETHLSELRAKISRGEVPPRHVWGGAVPGEMITYDIRPGAPLWSNPNIMMPTNKDVMERRHPVQHELAGTYFESLTPEERERAARDPAFRRRLMVFMGLTKAPFYYSKIHGKQNVHVTAERSGSTFFQLPNKDPFLGGKYFKFELPPWSQSDPSYKAYKERVNYRGLEIPQEKLPPILSEWKPTDGIDYFRSQITQYFTNDFPALPLSRLDSDAFDANDVLTDDQVVGLKSRRYAMAKIAESIALAAQMGLVTINKPVDTAAGRQWGEELFRAYGSPTAPFAAFRDQRMAYTGVTWTLKDTEVNFENDLQYIYGVLGLRKGDDGSPLAQTYGYGVHFSGLFNSRALASNFDISNAFKLSRERMESQARQNVPGAYSDDSNIYVRASRIREQAALDYTAVMHRSIADGMRDCKGFMLTTALSLTAVLANFFA